MQRALLLLVVVTFIPRAAAAQGEPVGPEFRVNTYTEEFQSYPSIAADDSGNFVVVWRSNWQDGFWRGVFGQRYASFGQRNTTSGAPVGPEFRVNTFTLNGQSDPSVASDASGNFVVVWWSEAFPGSDSPDGFEEGVFGQRYANTGEPLGPEFRVHTFTTGLQLRPSVASDAVGNFVIVWDSGGDHDGSGYGIFAQRYDTQGNPLGGEFRVNTYTTSHQISPAVASDSSGNFVVVWRSNDQDGSSFGVFGQRYASTGEPLGPEFRVNTYPIDQQRQPAVASDSSGNFVVVWTSYLQDGSAFGVFGQRYASTGTPLGGEFRVNTYTTDDQFYPAVASDASGNFVVVWQSHDQEGLGRDLYGVFGQRYARTGAALGPEFRVNTYLIDGEPRPSVAADASGRFVVVWDTPPGGLGSDTDVFGQRFSRIAPGPSWRTPTDPVELE